MSPAGSGAGALPGSAWSRYAELIGSVRPGGLARIPRFMVVSPPKTGSTWLHRRLAACGAVRLARKELIYFCTLWRWYGIDAYLESFEEGEGLVRGEVSGSYSLLPVRALRAVRALFPDLRIVLVLREPVARTWSHLRHDHRFGVGAFRGFEGALDSAPGRERLDRYGLDYWLLYSDYLSLVSRWLSVFPASQVLVGFLDDISRDPRGFLARVLGFIGVDPARAEGLDGLERPEMTGVEARLPDDLRARIERATAGWLLRLDELLRDRLGVRLPGAWLAGRAAGGARAPTPTDEDLQACIDGPVQDARLPRLHEEGRQGFNVLFHGGRFHAIAQAAGEFDLHRASEAQVDALAGRGWYAVEDSPGAISRSIAALAARGAYTNEKS